MTSLVCLVMNPRASGTERNFKKSLKSKSDANAKVSWSVPPRAVTDKDSLGAQESRKLEEVMARRQRQCESGSDA